jgi:hypothetical protein
MQHRHALEPPPQRLRQLVIGGVHAGELGGAERLAVPPRNADAVEHVGEGDLAAVGHVGVPVLAGIGEAEGLAVLDDVGERHHLGMRRVLEGVRDVDLERAEAAGKRLERGGIEMLAGEAQDAVAAERRQQHAEFRIAERLRQVHAVDGGAEDPPAGRDGDHGPPFGRRARRFCRCRNLPRSCLSSPSAECQRLRLR